MRQTLSFISRSSAPGFTSSRPRRAAAPRCVRAAALPRFDQLLPPLPWLRPSPATPRNPVAAERDELLSILIGGSSSTNSSSSSKQRAASEARASALVDVLSDAALPFDEALLGGGPWVVVFTKGAPQLWKATWQTGRLISGNPGNEASQDFDPSDRSALNKAEYWGGNVYVTAGGTYEPLGDGKTTPQLVRADISSGALCLWSLEVPLPIRGSGKFEVMYLDDTLRIFRSGGAISVQVKRSELRKLSKGQAQ